MASTDTQFKKGNLANPNAVRNLTYRIPKGHIPWNKGKTGYTTKKKNKKFPHISGEFSSNWKGGITPINEKIRKSLEYRLWRTAVFERDSYTCIWCGSTGKLEADHIKPFALFPELRFAIDNGRTLCKDCHKKTDTYGYKCLTKIYE